MADNKYNIEIELKSKLEEASKIINSINDIELATENLTASISKSQTIIEGAFYNIGAQISNFALKLPSAFTASIKAFGEQELATQKLAAAIRSQDEPASSRCFSRRRL